MTIKATSASDFRKHNIWRIYFRHNKRQYEIIFILLLHSYASGARDVVIVHHWAGYPKKNKEKVTHNT